MGCTCPPRCARWLVRSTTCFVTAPHRQMSATANGCLTTRCSGLAALAAELGIVGPPASHPTLKSKQLGHSASVLVTAPMSIGSAGSLRRLGCGRRSVPQSRSCRFVIHTSDVCHRARRPSPMPAASSASPPIRPAASHAWLRCGGQKLVPWVRHRGRSVSSANVPLRQGRESRHTTSRGSRRAQRQASTPGSVQRGSPTHLGQESLRIITARFGLPPKVGPTTGCSGLASLAAEPCIVRQE